ncbi:MAG: prefoldin subunit alpha [Candidatus Kariarchaeaceae archaeon]
MSLPIQPPQEYQPNIQDIYAQYQAAARQLQAYENQEAQVTSIVEELSLNRATLDGLGTNSKESEIILPLGGIMMIKAKLSGLDEVLINVGSEIIVPETIDRAKEIVDSRLNEMKELLNKMINDRYKLEEIIARLQSQMNELNQQNQQR